MSLKLVSSTPESSFPATLDTLMHQNQAAEREGLRTRLARAAKEADVSDYRIFETTNTIALHLPSHEEHLRTSIALRGEGRIQDYFLQAVEGYDFRKLKNYRHRIQNAVRQTELCGEIHIDVDRAENSLVVIAENKRAYFDFRAMMIRTGVIVPQPVGM